MHLFWILLLTAACAAPGESLSRALWQFGQMIKCMQPNVNPFMYNNYGCYCGFSGSGTPRDQVDQCCFEHDICYEKARKLPECPTFLNLPYFKVYNFSCSKKVITCPVWNDKCQAAVCKCDQAAANCFAQHHHVYNHNYSNFPRGQCKN